MKKIGYSLILNASEVHFWNGLVGMMEYRDGSGKLIMRFQGSRMKTQLKGTDGNTYQIVERYRVEHPSRYHIEGVESISFDGTKTIVDPNWTPSHTLEEAKAERKAEVQAAMRQELFDTIEDVMVAFETAGNFGQAKSAISSIIVTKRADIRAHAVTLESQIDALLTLVKVDEFVIDGWPE